MFLFISGLDLRALEARTHLLEFRVPWVESPSQENPAQLRSKYKLPVNFEPPFIHVEKKALQGVILFGLFEKYFPKSTPVPPLLPNEKIQIKPW